MSGGHRARNFFIGAAILLTVPVVLTSIVGIRTLNPLKSARRSMAELELKLEGSEAFVPAASIDAERFELFLACREEMVSACGDYGAVQKGFEQVDSLDEETEPSLEVVGDTAWALGGAAFEITPFLGRYFALRNEVLLNAEMSLDEYAFLYAVSYREQLLADSTRYEIFSDGDAISPEASAALLESLESQLDRMAQDDPLRPSIDAEIRAMRADRSRLAWQGGLPAGLEESIEPYRARLDALFCPATAGLEMERSAKRAILIALE